MKQERDSGLLLTLAAGLAIFIANSVFSIGWESFLDSPLLAVASHLPPELASPRLLIGNGLMAVFFFTVGLEIKREALVGRLANPMQRRLPVLAALAGMMIPALIYLGVVRSEPGLAGGWAIPCATDIAFVLGVMALLGSRVPRGLRLFLLAVAVVDDIGAVVVIALAYTAQVAWLWLAAGTGVLAALVALNRAGVARVAPYLALSGVLWWCVLQSGVHATVAGVLAALTIPLTQHQRHGSALRRLEHRLAPWSGYAIVPLFALAHAGVRLGGTGDSRLSLAIGAGLALGKPIGVCGAIILAERLGYARRPAQSNWLQTLGAGQLAGIGFTMSIFIGTLAFPGEPMRGNAIRLGILGGSALSAMMGAALLWLGARKPAP